MPDLAYISGGALALVWATARYGWVLPRDARLWDNFSAGIDCILTRIFPMFNDIFHLTLD